MIWNTPTICKHFLGTLHLSWNLVILVWCHIPSDYLAHFFQDEFAKHKMIKGDDNCEKMLFVSQKNVTNILWYIPHVYRCELREFLEKDHLFTTDVQNTNWWISTMPVPSLFSPRVPSSPSLFVLRMVLNDCTYRHTHVPLLLLSLQFASLNEREGIYFIFRFWEEGE